MKRSNSVATTEPDKPFFPAISPSEQHVRHPETKASLFPPTAKPDITQHESVSKIYGENLS